MEKKAEFNYKKKKSETGSLRGKKRTKMAMKEGLNRHNEEETAMREEHDEAKTEEGEGRYVEQGIVFNEYGKKNYERGMNEGEDSA